MLLQKEDSFGVERFTAFNKTPDTCIDRRKPTSLKCDRAKSELKQSYQTGQSSFPRVTERLISAPHLVEFLKLNPAEWRHNSLPARVKGMCTTATFKINTSLKHRLITAFSTALY